MEKFPILRRLPKRIVCLYLTCAMLGACALFTLYLESDNPLTSTVQNVLATGEFDLEAGHAIRSSAEYSDSRLSDRVVPPGWSWKRRLIISPQNISEANGKLIDASNKSNTPVYSSKHRTPKRDNTKYIHLNTVPTASSSSKGASDLITKATTPVPLPPETCESANKKDSKLILLWTSFFDYWNYLPKENFAQCARCRNCRVTRDRSKLHESDAVIFHARDMSLSDLPAVRYPHQKWVFYCLESPPYSDFPGLQYMKNMFNWTMTYRADSDIVTQYGSFSRIRPSRKLDLEPLQWVFSNKSRSVVWMSSHCPTHGGRDDYVAELRKYIDVDVYGTCGTSICPPGETNKCLQEFSGKYKFFLAFENTICKDYITEKFFRTLKFDIVPVVFGGAVYDKFAPPGSFIDALSFKSPKHLAFFLTGVGRDFKLYSNYFRWRKDYSVRLSNQKECNLCALLHRTDLKPSSYGNLRKWWIDESQCRSWRMKP